MLELPIHLVTAVFAGEWFPEGAVRRLPPGPARSLLLQATRHMPVVRRPGIADTAAHLVDRVFPEVPVRQWWVLSLPVALRYRLAFDALLVRDVLRKFVRAEFG